MACRDGNGFSKRFHEGAARPLERPVLHSRHTSAHSFGDKYSRALRGVTCCVSGRLRGAGLSPALVHVVMFALENRDD